MKKNIIITILCVLVVGLSSFIIYDKTIKKEDREENNIVEKSDEVVNIKKIDSNVISWYLMYHGSFNKNNVLDSAEKRLELIDYILQVGKYAKYTDSETVQSHPYIKYDDYAAMYKEVYGDNYSLGTDSSDVESVIYYDCSNEFNDGNKYVCWNGTWGSTGEVLVNSNINKYEMDNEFYLVSGSYVKRSDEGKEINIKFTMKYKVQDKKGYLFGISQNY